MLGGQKAVEKKPALKRVEFDLSDLKKELKTEIRAELDAVRKEQAGALSGFAREIEKLGAAQNIPRHTHSDYVVKAELEKWAQSLVELQDTVYGMVVEFNKLVEVLHGRH